MIVNASCHFHIFVMKMHIVDRVNKFFYIMVFFNLQSSTLEPLSVFLYKT